MPLSNLPDPAPLALWFDETVGASTVRLSTRSFNAVTGTSAADLIVLRKVSSGVSGSVTWGADEIAAGLGNDRVDASRGDDRVYGDVATGGSSLSAGDDRIKGGPGNDLVYGDGQAGAGYARFGNDQIDGGIGDDEIIGDAADLTNGVRPGDDRLYGAAGSDVLRGDGLELANIGASGNDRLYGGPGSDVLVGDADRLRPGAQGGVDTLDGGTGNDILVGDGLLEPGADGVGDTLLGGAGDDRLYGDSPIGEDVVRFGGTAGSAPWAYNQDGGSDRLEGGPGDDLLVGGNAPDDLFGGEGADTFLFFPSEEDFRDGTEDRIHDFEPGEDKIDLTWWDLDGITLDSNGDEIIDDAEDIVALDGTDLVIDLDASSVEDASRYGVFLRIKNVSELALDDLVPIPPPEG